AERRRAESPSPRHDRDAVNVGRTTHMCRRDRMSGLVHGYAASLLVVEEVTSAARAREHALDGLVQVLARYLRGPRANAQQCGLVDDVGEIGAREPRRLSGYRSKIGVARHRAPTRVELEDLGPSLGVGLLDQNVPVEAAGTQQCRIEDVGTVRRGDDDDAGGHVEAVDLDEKLIERLIPLLAAAGKAAHAGATRGIELVDEHNGGSHALNPGEQVA